MANLSRTRTVFAFTSPRTIEKIIPEIKILVGSFQGKEWNAETQRAFFEELYGSDYYEGSQRPKDPAFAARDRITRAPKALGFVDLSPKIALTAPGAQLLSGKRSHEVIARQLFKFQLPSPFHKIPADRHFNIRPYLELLRLVREVGMISKTEVAIFFTQLTDHNDFEDLVSSIEGFRKNSAKNKVNRKAFVDRVFTKEILKIYAKDIKANKIKTRESLEESLDKFVRTKKQNHNDYADAFIRYLRATQLISFDNRSFRMIISPSRAKEVDYLLREVPRDAAPFKSENDYKDYLFDLSSLKLLTDERTYLTQRLSRLKVHFTSKEHIEELKDRLEKQEEKMITQAREETETSLKGYRQFGDVVAVFDQIKKREVPDPPLYFEWNIWRAFVMMNYAKDIRGNFTVDLDGLPLTAATGNKPDIEAEYDGFKMIIEVTMSSGSKQYDMEGEPVARHYGRAQMGSSVPVYCLFVAPTINENTLAHFFNTNRFKTKAYGGKTRIIPMNLPEFISFMTIAKDRRFTNPNDLKGYLDGIIERNSSAEDEAIWYQSIGESIATWIS